MKNKDLKNPDKYTLGKKRKFNLLKFIIRRFGIFIIFMIFIVIISGKLFISEINFFPFLSLPIIACIIYSEISQFKAYYNEKYFNKFESADKSSLYSGNIQYHLSNNSPANDNFFIAETNIHRLVQIIRGRNCYYIHYLTVKNDGIGFNQSSLITDFRNIDICKLYNSKDYRINLNSVKCIRYSEKSVKNTVCKNYGAVLIQKTQKSKTKNKIFYPVTKISDYYLIKFFSDIRNFSLDISDTKNISYKKALKNFSRKRIAYIIMKNLYYILTVLISCGTFPNYQIYCIFTTASMILITAILILYCFSSNEFTIKDYHNSEQNGDFSSKPNIARGIICPLFFNTMVSLLSCNILTLSFSRYVLISLIFSFIIAVILIICSSGKKIILSSVMIALTFSFSNVININYIFDFTEPSVHDSQIYDKYISSGSRSGNTYYIKIKLDNGDTESIRVTTNEYYNCKNGDIVSVYEYKGLLDIPYAEIYFHE
jgi:hypothetical protein